MKKLILLCLLGVFLCSFSTYKGTSTIHDYGKVKMAVISNHDSIESAILNLKKRYEADCLGDCFSAFDSCTQGSPPYSGCFDALFSCIRNCPV